MFVTTVTTFAVTLQNSLFMRDFTEKLVTLVTLVTISHISGMKLYDSLTLLTFSWAGGSVFPAAIIDSLGKKCLHGAGALRCLSRRLPALYGLFTISFVPQRGAGLLSVPWGPFLQKSLGPYSTYAVWAVQCTLMSKRHPLKVTRSSLIC